MTTSQPNAEQPTQAPRMTEQELHAWMRRADAAMRALLDRHYARLAAERASGISTSGATGEAATSPPSDTAQREEGA